MTEWGLASDGYLPEQINALAGRFEPPNFDPVQRKLGWPQSLSFYLRRVGWIDVPVARLQWGPLKVAYQGCTGTVPVWWYIWRREGSGEGIGRMSGAGRRGDDKDRTREWSIAWATVTPTGQPIFSVEHLPRENDEKTISWASDEMIKMFDTEVLMGQTFNR
jgi:hypothetical protein